MASLSYGGSESAATSVHVGETHTMSERLKALMAFINSEDGRIMGRTPMSWGKIGLFYLVFYACLGAFFAVTLAVFYQTIDLDYPKLQGSDSILSNNPGLGFRPLPDVKTSLIRFVKGKPWTYKIYTDHIKGFLDYYENAQQNSDNFMECRSIKSYRPKHTWNKVCKFDLSLDLANHKPCISDDDYGYDDGTPCIILKLNKIYGWMPEPYVVNSTGDDDIPEGARIPPAIEGDYDPNYIAVQCTGESVTDQENIGKVVYFPPNGFHVKFYPYLNQQGYRQPIVFAHFQSITNGVVVMINCKAYAKNIRHNTLELAGSVHFEILVD